MAWLELVAAGDAKGVSLAVGDRFPLDPITQTVFGREREVAISAQHPGLNRRSFGIRFEDGRWLFNHFGGVNPIVVNGQSGFPRDLPLRDGDLICPVQGLVFRFGDGKPSAAA